MEYCSKEEATRAIHELNRSAHWPKAQTPLIVEPVHPDATLLPEAPINPEEDAQFSVFFAKVPPCVPASEVVEVFGSCGKVVAVNLFKPWANSKTSKVSRKVYE